VTRTENVKKLTLHLWCTLVRNSLYADQIIQSSVTAGFGR